MKDSDEFRENSLLHLYGEMTTTGKVGNMKTDQKVMCTICTEIGDEAEAVMICKEPNCNEKLCDGCYKRHQKQRATKNHEVIRLEDDLSSKDGVLCELCEDEDVPGFGYCTDCDYPEILCNKCCKRHTASKNFLNHKISQDLKLLHKMRKRPQVLSTEAAVNYNSTRSHRGNGAQTRIAVAEISSSFQCEPCRFENMSVAATQFCLDCTEPEPMCTPCAQQHLRQKIGRGHDLSKGMLQYRTRQGGFSSRQDERRLDESSEPAQKLMNNPHWKSRNENISQETAEKATIFPCEPCQFEGKLVTATQFCLNCQEQEAYCYPCGQQHLRQRIGRGHRLSQSMDLFNPQQETMLAKRSLDSGTKIKKPTSSKDTPGKPSPDIIKSDSVNLHWQKCNGVDYYQMRYKSKDGKENWKFIPTDGNKTEMTIGGLMADTTYIFQVRGVKGDIEGPYGQANEEIKTRESLASHLLKFSKEMSKGNPSKFELPFEENPRARNQQYKIRQICLGNTKKSNQEEEKTIMLVGATGSGKSTLVDGIVNYVMGVSFEDPFRFTLVKLEDEERHKTGNQAVSQTEWVTVYKIAPQRGGRLDFTLNIIDTPGFGDTRGIDRDNIIVDQVRYLFSAKGDEGVLFLDSVCFIVKAPDARLTPVQKYIFHAIMSLFGKDIESNICTLITFADGADPPVLACLKEAKLPYGNAFQFNNSALFATNKDLRSNSLSPFFWEMGCKSFEAFFINLKEFETRSLSQTKDVLREREQLKSIISNLRPQITAGLSKLSELRDQLDLFNRHKNDIESNKDFTYEVDETKQVLEDLPPGQHVTNCLQCNVTCHKDCRIADDEEKNRCWAMTEGYCRICSGKCYWDQHKNTPYIFTYRTDKVTKTYQEMKERYEKAIGEKLTHEKYLTELAVDVDDLMEDIMDKVEEMNSCKTRLKEIALRPDPLSTVDHIDQMIQAEESERQPGYGKRVKMLQEMRKMALVDKDYENLDQHFRSTRSDVTSAVGRDIRSQRTPRGRKREKQGALAKGIKLFAKIFGH